jgi:hypothetical protein
MSAAAAIADVTLLNRRPTILHLPPLFAVPKDAEGNDRPDLQRSVPLTPGDAKRPVATVVRSDVWGRCKEHKAVKQWLRLGWIAVKPADVAAPTEAPPPDNLLEYNVQAAIALVDTEKSEANLRAWIAAEGRQPVRDALNKRLVAIAQPAAKQPAIKR